MGQAKPLGCLGIPNQTLQASSPPSNAPSLKIGIMTPVVIWSSLQDVIGHRLGLQAGSDWNKEMR